MGMAEEQKNLPVDEEALKRVSFYQVALGAWVQTRMEADKQMLALSALAVGFLISFHDKLNHTWDFLLWVLSGLLFLATIGAMLIVFRLNAKYLSEINKDETDKNNKNTVNEQLKLLTKFGFWTFFLGVFLASVLAVNLSNFTITREMQIVPAIDCDSCEAVNLNPNNGAKNG
ncbi:MAG: hypothetical protein ACPH5J_02065 [Candidatus Puniceispirillum sp.]